MRPKPVIRKHGDQWMCTRPSVGFAVTSTITMHPTWRAAVRALEPPAVASSSGGLFEQGSAHADAVSAVPLWTPLWLARGWTTGTRP